MNDSSIIELKNICRKNKIKNYSNVNKKELINLIYKNIKKGGNITNNKNPITYVPKEKTQKLENFINISKNKLTKNNYNNLQKWFNIGNDADKKIIKDYPEVKMNQLKNNKIKSNNIDSGYNFNLMIEIQKKNIKLMKSDTHKHISLEEYNDLFTRKKNKKNQIGGSKTNMIWDQIINKFQNNINSSNNMNINDNRVNNVNRGNQMELNIPSNIGNLKLSISSLSHKFNFHNKLSHYAGVIFWCDTDTNMYNNNEIHIIIQDTTLWNNSNFRRVGSSSRRGGYVHDYLYKLITHKNDINDNPGILCAGFSIYNNEDTNNKWALKFHSKWLNSNTNNIFKNFNDDNKTCSIGESIFIIAGVNLWANKGPSSLYWFPTNYNLNGLIKDHKGIEEEFIFNLQALKFYHDDNIDIFNTLSWEKLIEEKYGTNTNDDWTNDFSSSLYGGDLSLTKLKGICAKKKLKNYSKLNKKDLLKLIQEGSGENNLDKSYIQPNKIYTKIPKTYGFSNKKSKNKFYENTYYNFSDLDFRQKKNDKDMKKFNNNEFEDLFIDKNKNKKQNKSGGGKICEDWNGIYNFLKSGKNKKCNFHPKCDDFIDNSNIKYAGAIFWHWKKGKNLGSLYNYAESVTVIIQNTSLWEYEDFRRAGNGMVHDKLYRDVIGDSLEKHRNHDNNAVCCSGFSIFCDKSRRYNYRRNLFTWKIKFNSIWLNGMNIPNQMCSSDNDKQTNRGETAIIIGAVNAWWNHSYNNSKGNSIQCYFENFRPVSKYYKDCGSSLNYYDYTWIINKSENNDIENRWIPEYWYFFI